MAYVTFFRDFRYSNQTSKCSNVLFIIFYFCSCRLLTKTEDNNEKYFLIKEKHKKSGVRYKKSHEVLFI
jgi:hypothetical protein